MSRNAVCSRRSISYLMTPKTTPWYSYNIFPLLSSSQRRRRRERDPTHQIISTRFAKESHFLEQKVTEVSPFPFIFSNSSLASWLLVLLSSSFVFFAELFSLSRRVQMKKNLLFTRRAAFVIIRPDVSGSKWNLFNRKVLPIADMSCHGLIDLRHACVKNWRWSKLEKSKNQKPRSWTKILLLLCSL